MTRNGNSWILHVQNLLSAKKKNIVHGITVAEGKNRSVSLTESIWESVKNVIQADLGSKQDVKFRSDAQAAAVFECAMQSVLTGYMNSMIVVLPTGGGKTLCWAAPVLREQRIHDEESKSAHVTILIVPLVGLQQDTVRKSTKYGIRCGLWEDRFNGNISLVVCSIDIVFSNEYDRYVSALVAKKTLVRVVVDEAHLLLQWKEFRNFGLVGERLRPSNARELPMLLMTATLPKDMISKLTELLKVDMSCFKLFRAKNSRPNICYQVQNLGTASEDDVLRICVSQINTELAKMKTHDRIIVYCLNVRECAILHKTLTNLGQKTCLYLGSMKCEERKAIFDSWMNSESDAPIAMISTSAFSCGIDYPHVRLVLHMGVAEVWLS